jgi:hypothetical protein
VLSPDQVSTTYRIGDATVTRVQELTLDVASPSMLYPEWRRELLDGPEDPLFPDSWDMSRTSLLQSIHTWVVQTPQHTILIDTATGNDKERPFVPALHHLHTPYLDGLKALASCPARWILSLSRTCTSTTLGGTRNG